MDNVGNYFDSVNNPWLTEENFKEALKEQASGSDFMPYLVSLASKYQIKLNKTLHQKLWYNLSKLPKYNKIELIYFNYGNEIFSAEELTELKSSPNTCIACQYAYNLRNAAISYIQPNMKEFFSQETCMCNFCPFTPFSEAKYSPLNYHHCFNNQLRYYNYASRMYHFLEVLIEDHCLEEDYFKLTNGDLEDHCNLIDEELEDFYNRVAAKASCYRFFPPYELFKKAFNYFLSNLQMRDCKTLEERMQFFLNLISIHARNIAFQDIKQNIITY